MSVATNRGASIQYERAGSGEPVLFLPTLGYGPWQWGWQFPAVAGPFEAIAPVLRGTAPSDTPDGPYDVSILAEDVEAVLADVGARRAHLVGFGLGGHVALEYAAQFGRARSLALIGTTPGLPEADPPASVVDRLHAPRDASGGTAAPLDALRDTLAPVLSAGFREEHPDVVEGIAEWRAEEDADRSGWAAQAPAFEDWGRSWPPYEVTEPTLVCHGTADQVAPPANATMLGDLLPNATVERYDGAGHLVTVERSRPLNDRLLGFLEVHASDD